MRHYGFAAVSLEQTASADAAVMAVERAYTAGAVKIGLNPDNIARFLLLGVGNLIPVVSELFMTAAEQATRANYSRLGDQIKRWKTVYRMWAVNGQRDDGTPYGWNQWSGFAVDLLGSIRAQTGYNADSSTLVAVKDAAVATLQTLGSPSRWPWWLWAGIGLGGLAVANSLLGGLIPRRRALSGR